MKTGKYFVAAILLVGGILILAYRVSVDGLYLVAQCCLVCVAIFAAGFVLRTEMERGPK